jgi:hypothetical protein
MMCAALSPAITPEGAEQLMNLRIVAVTFALTLAAGRTLAAAPDEDLLEALGKCAAIADDHARLVCYDAMAPHVHQALAAPPAALPNNRQPTAEEQKSWFGFNLSDLFGSGPAEQTTPQQFGADQMPATHEKVEQAEKEIDSISAGVTEFAFTPNKKFIVFLDNGQVWRQLQGDADEAHFHRTAADNKVMIERGLLGSYNLHINDSSKTYKVERVK